jgi:hypothetical protein
METVIKKLSEIEIAAKKIMEDAHEQASALNKRMHDKSTAFDNSVDEDTNQKLDTLRQNLQNQTNDALAKLRSDTEKNLTSLKSYYQAHHNTVSEEIYKKIIGV